MAGQVASRVQNLHVRPRRGSRKRAFAVALGRSVGGSGLGFFDGFFVWIKQSMPKGRAFGNSFLVRKPKSFRWRLQGF